MGIVDVHTVHLFSASRRRSLGTLSPLPPRVTDDESKPLAYTSEAPDPRYWTAYDYHMIERDARARRRAELYSMIATWGKRLWQRLFSTMTGVRADAARNVMSLSRH